MNNAAINSHVSSSYFYLYSFLFDHPYFSFLCIPSDPIYTISNFFLQGSNISNKVSPPFSSGDLLSSSSNLDGYPQIYSIPFLLAHSFSALLCQSPCFLNPQPFFFAADSQVWLKLFRVWEVTWGPSDSHLASLVPPPTPKHPEVPGWTGSFLISIPSALLFTFQRGVKPLVYRTLLCTEVLFVLKSLYCLCPFRSLKKGLRRKKGGKREECLVGSLGRLVISLFFSCAGSLLWCTGFSCHRAWASVVRACRLRSCSWWGALECSSADVAHGLCDSSTRGIFQGQGLNPWPLHWLADFYSLCHQGRPGGWVLISVIWVVPQKSHFPM